MIQDARSNGTFGAFTIYGIGNSKQYFDSNDHCGHSSRGEQAFVRFKPVANIANNNGHASRRRTSHGPAIRLNSVNIIAFMSQF